MSSIVLKVEDRLRRACGSHWDKELLTECVKEIKELRRTLKNAMELANTQDKLIKAQDDLINSLKNKPKVFNA